MGISLKTLWRSSLRDLPHTHGVKEPQLARELEYNNLSRAMVALYGFLLIGVIFFLLRIFLFRLYQSVPGNMILLSVNLVIMGGSFAFIMLYHRFLPRSPETLKPAHTLMLHATIVFFVFTLGISTGVEYIGTGSLSRLFFAIVSICFVFTLNWKTLLAYVLSGSACTVATVYLLKGDILTLGLQHMHAPIAILVVWIVSRIFYLYSVRDYYTRKELERANISLREEMAGRLHAMESLERSERQLRTLIEKAPDAYILFDAEENVFSEINAYAEALFLLTNEEVAGKTVHQIDILSPEQAEIAEFIIRETIRDGFAGPYEFELIRKDGKTIVVEVYASLAVIQARTILIGTARDITWRRNAEQALIRSKDDLEQRVRTKTAHVIKASERLRKEISSHKQTENVLRKTEEQSRMLIQKMNDGFAVFDRNMVFTYANDRLCRMLGRSEDWLLEHSLFDLVAPEDVEALRANLERPRNDGHGTFETVLIRNDNTRIHAIVSPETLLDSQGNPESLFSVITDISRIKTMENALRESEEMTRSLINASRDSVVMLDRHGTVLMANDTMARLLNTASVDMKGKNIFSLIRSTRTPVRRLKLKEAVDKNEPLIYEDRIGGRYYVLHIYPIAERDGDVARIAVFARDVTDLRIAEQHIHSLSQELIKIQETERHRIARDLHDNVAQELASLKIGCDMMIDGPGEVNPKMADRIRTFSKVLQNSIMSIRNLAYDLRPPELDQLGLVRTITNYCDEFSERNGIPVDFFSAGMSELRLRPETEINLYRIVQEALYNVKKHAAAGQVLIRLITSFPSIILRIEDNGKGFDPERRIESSFAEKRMGLRSMEERALLLKGVIRIRSQRGKGTGIMVEIPLEDNIISQDSRVPGDDNEHDPIQ